MTRWNGDLRQSDITPKSVWLGRRQVLAGMGFAGMAALLPRGAQAEELVPNSFEEITNYNNFYEFGPDKTDPARHAGALRTVPWAVVIDGLVDRPGTYDLGDVIASGPIEERIYRLRCVEGWSMIIPWQGFELGHLLRRVGVQPAARHVRFETLVRPDEMPGQRRGLLDWPYVEGLRLDEAMHPLTLLATGLYDQPLPNQNGAPLRLVVPWKYGFKSIKSIVRITLQAEQPVNTWQAMNAREYGYYANVNPNVSHPRWSQATERPIGGGIFATRRDTVLFNGYGDQVAALYAGMDLARDY